MFIPQNYRMSVLILVLLLVSILQAFGADASKFREGLDEAGAERRIGTRYPLPTAETPFEKFIATGSQTVGTSAAVLLATPATYTRVVTVGAIDDAMNYGPSTVPTGEAYPFYIASGSTKDFILATTTPKIYLRGRTATGTAHRLEQ